MIKTQLIGHLGNDCNVNQVNGKTVINFSVAHTEKFKDAQGVQKVNTLWVNCAYWTDRTAVAQYLQKGTLVFVEGQPDIRTYKDKQNNVIPQLHLRVNQIQLLGGSKKEESGNAPAANNSQSYAGNDIVNNEPIDDLPF